MGAMRMVWWCPACPGAKELSLRACTERRDPVGLLLPLPDAWRLWC